MARRKKRRRRSHPLVVQMMVDCFDITMMLHKLDVQRAVFKARGVREVWRSADEERAGFLQICGVEDIQDG